jgi:hypothetical protein
VTHRPAAKSLEGSRQPGGEIRPPPRLRSGSWRSSDLRLHPTSCVRSCRGCPQLSGRLPTQHGQACSSSVPLGQVQPDLRIGSCWRWVGRSPGPAAIPMASAGARGDCQDVRGLSSWQGGTGRGRGGNPRPCTVMDRDRQLTPGRSQGEGDSSPWVSLIRQVHDCLGPSDIFAVRQIADGLDAKRLP